MSDENATVRDSWAREHFQLTSETMQTRLKRYLQMPHMQRECPEGLNTEAAQLSWITERATKECSDWVHSILNDLTKYDIPINTRPTLLLRL